MKKRSMLHFGMLTFVWATLSACSGDPTPPPVAPTGASQNAAPNSASDATTSSIAISSELAKLCDIPTALFPFDSAAVSKEARAALDALATCFTSGKAKDKGMRVVGHADERGEEQYNFGLGQRRAGAVEAYVVKRGVKDDRVESSSRGELDATGQDDSGWAKDRRVAIYLAD
jgi:peptidoglycan-associated lipoprotein